MESIEQEEEAEKREAVRNRVEELRSQLEQKVSEVNKELMDEGNSSPVRLELARLGNEMLKLYALFPEIEVGSEGSLRWEADLGVMTRQFEDLWKLRDATTGGFIVHDTSFGKH